MSLVQFLTVITCNFSIQQHYIVKRTGNEKKESHHIVVSSGEELFLQFLGDNIIRYVKDPVLTMMLIARLLLFSNAARCAMHPGQDWVFELSLR